MTLIEAAKQAREAFEWNFNTDLDNIPACERWAKMLKENINALDKAIAKAEQQEPVVWMYQDKSTHEVRFQKHMRDFVDHSKTSEVPLYGEPLPNHELQCVCGAVWCGDEMVHLPNKTPPKREWQGLTDEEMHECWDSPLTPLGMKHARMIEAKLKEKNT